MLYAYLLRRNRTRRLYLLGTGTLFILAVLVSDSLAPPAAPFSQPPGARRLLQTSTEAPRNCSAKSNTSSSQFPPDLFSDENLAKGAFVLHAVGLAYMFVALAIVCDEFFVPSLGVITEKLQISDDVAGATFMAAGGSAPEFFTSVIGVFIAQDNVGIGTIVGSATFNILCVLAFCCLFSKGVLHLTWWPLFRDVSFYIISLGLIVGFFLDEKIYWWEAFILFLIYIAYCTFMKFNEQLEIFVKTRILGQSIQVLGTESSVVAASPPNHEPAEIPVAGADLPPNYGSSYHGSSRPSSVYGHHRRNSSGRRQSIPILHSGAMFRNGIVQLMVHTLDPLSELHVDDKLVQLQGMASVKVVLERSALPGQGQMMNGATASEGQRNPAFLPDSFFAPVPGTPEDDESTLKSVVGAGERSGSGGNRAPLQEEEPRLGPPQSLAQQRLSASSGYSSGRTTPGLYAQSYRGAAPSVFLFNVEGLVQAKDEFGARKETRVSEELGGMHPPQQSYQLNDKYNTEIQNGKLGASGDITSKNPDLPKRESGLEEEEGEEIEEPLDVTWPTSWRKQITYIILAPIVFPLWVTIPDVRRPQSRKWFPVTFVGSIFWIAFFSWLMVWWADTLGRTIGIPIEIMGLTILAAGTSIPDLITSVIVARKGLGDMAVSSSIGSNIFDVCVGLPVPWLLFFIVFGIMNKPGTDYIAVESKGLVCSVLMLFVMLVVLIAAIGLFHWKMNNWFGVVMLCTYVGFVVVSVMLETGKLECFLRTSSCS